MPASTLEDHWRDLRSDLKRFVRSRVRDEATAEDVLQATFLKAHIAFSEGMELEHPRAWLFQVARNLVIDLTRAEGRARTAMDALELDPTAGSAEPESPETDTVFALVARALPVFIAQIDEPYRRALELTELQGLSQAEAARTEGIGRSAMKSRVQRGRRQVHEAMLRCCRFEVDGRGRVLEATPHTPEGCLAECRRRC